MTSLQKWFLKGRGAEGSYKEVTEEYTEEYVDFDHKRFEVFVYSKSRSCMLSREVTRQVWSSDITGDFLPFSLKLEVAETECWGDVEA
jgi:hypothetical protein